MHKRSLHPGITRGPASKRTPQGKTTSPPKFTAGWWRGCLCVRVSHLPNICGAAPRGEKPQGEQPAGGTLGHAHARLPSVRGEDAAFGGKPPDACSRRNAARCSGDARLCQCYSIPPAAGWTRPAARDGPTLAQAATSKAGNVCGRASHLLEEGVQYTYARYYMAIDFKTHV